MSPEELLSFGFSKELIVVIISALPITELRGAVPVAINLFHFPWYYAFLLAVIGNILPVPFILLFLNVFSKLLNKVNIFRNILNYIFKQAAKRGKIIEKYQRIGLVLFVAIPLPVTGAWTGSFAANLLGLKFKHAFISIFIGILIAGTIVTCLSLLGYTGAIIAGVGLISMCLFSFWRSQRQN
ncbi:MAG: small multi-drug export protein [Dehalococcoidales bacterium]|nr:small multi-drug export protein [Dehalococcoidales bacterium]